MIKIVSKFIILFYFLFCKLNDSYSQPSYISLDGGSMSTKIWSSGKYNNNPATTSGLEWPKGSGKFLVYTSGLNIAGYVNNELRMISTSYNGECVPGYSLNGNFYTDYRFRFYKIKKGDNYLNNPDWLNWGLMVPFGAPYYDVNQNGIYEYYIDTPGLKDADQTIFISLTDGDTSKHILNEGFGGGTKPLYAEIHLTSWCYDIDDYKDMQFFKWEVINRNVYSWEKTYICNLSFNELGFSGDDFTGCDTIRRLSFCYNSDNDDEVGFRGYGINPPAFGTAFLSCGTNIKMTSSVYMLSTSSPSPVCEKEVYASIPNAYNVMKGFKSDGTNWVIPNTSPPRITKYCYPGDPEAQTGWTEFQGKINNCGGSLTGSYAYPNIGGKRYSLMSYGSDSLTISANDSITLFCVQLVARGNSNLNSVTKLKALTDKANELCNNGFIIGVQLMSHEIPSGFRLYQNYPNPFNAVTKIKFSIPKPENVLIKIYDAIGREAAILINEKLKPGVYSLDWDATMYPSGVYFYQITSGNYSETRKMVLMK